MAVPRPTPIAVGALACAAVAATVAAGLEWFAPPGADLAAHVYQRELFLRHGFSLWNNFWYAGRYSFVGYSLLYYPLAAVIGIKALAVASSAAAAAAFDVVVVREWGRPARWAAWTFALVAGASVISGAFPYALGLALALGALSAAQRRRFRWFAALVVLTWAASPLAFVLLVVVLCALVGLRRRGAIARPAAAVALTGVGAVAVWRVFPDSGRFPFSTAEVAPAVAFCVLGAVFCWRVESARVLRYVFVAYGVACVLAYAVPSGLGENVARLRFVAVPLAVLTLSLRRWRPIVPALVAFVLALSWNVTPLAASFERAAEDPSAAAAYWQPVVSFLRRDLGPSYRVEAVDTTGHWEAVYLARAGIPIVRGWFRQDDFPQNALLYGPVGRREYGDWLRRFGVRYVVLTSAPVDYSARGEAALLRGGRSGLVPVYRTSAATVYAVPRPASIVHGDAPARVVALRPSAARLWVARRGTYRVAIRYSPYWQSRGACIARTGDGMIELHAHRAGTIRIRFVVSARHVFAALSGNTRDCT